MVRLFSFGIVAAAMLFACGSADAGLCRKRCAVDCCGPEITYHNEYVTEKRIVKVVEYVKEECVRQVKVCKPEWVVEPRMVKYLEKVEYEEDVPVKKAVYTDSVVTKHRTVCRVVPVHEVKTVTVNTGHWETVAVDSCCGDPCDPCCRPSCRPSCKKVWVGGCEEREVTCVRYETVKEEVPYECKVRTCSYVDAMVKVKKCRYEPREKQVDVKVCKYNEVIVEQKYYVCKPVCVEKEIEVTVCRRVPVVVDDCYSDCYSDCCSDCCDTVSHCCP